MSNFLICSRSGPDRKLHLEIDVQEPDADFEVELVVRPKRPEGTDWPAGYFDLFGSIADESLVRPPQGDFSRVRRLELEDWQFP